MEDGNTMNKFIEFLKEKKKSKSTHIDFEKLEYIAKNVEKFSKLTEAQAKDLDVDDIDKFNRCLMGMQGCSVKCKEIYEKVL